jgi:hypothetical protein
MRYLKFHIDACICMCLYVYVYINLYSHIYMFTYVSYIRICIIIHSYILIHIYIHIYIYIHSYKHISVYTQEKLNTTRNFIQNESVRKLDILIVDDNHKERSILADVLRNDGHNCFEVVDGLDCIDKYMIVQSLNSVYKTQSGRYFFLIFLYVRLF